MCVAYLNYVRIRKCIFYGNLALCIGPIRSIEPPPRCNHACKRDMADAKSTQVLGSKAPVKREHALPTLLTSRHFTSDMYYNDEQYSGPPITGQPIISIVGIGSSAGNSFLRSPLLRTHIALHTTSSMHSIHKNCMPRNMILRRGLHYNRKANMARV